MNFDDIDYLKNGTHRQKQAYAVLTRYTVLEKLAVYDALLVGTIPLTIDIDTSDLDIICFYTKKQDLLAVVNDNFGSCMDFSIKEHHGEGNPIIAKFILDDFTIEIFAQTIPTKEQLAYRHMVIEHAILVSKGEPFRQQIIELKKQGIKTEPAFGMLLGLTNNPYEELLNYRIDDVHP